MVCCNDYINCIYKDWDQCETISSRLLDTMPELCLRSLTCLFSVYFPTPFALIRTLRILFFLTLRYNWHNIVLISGVQHNASRLVYIAKWSARWFQVSSVTTDSCKWFVLVMTTFKIHSPTYFQICKTELLITVTMLFITSPWLKNYEQNIAMLPFFISQHFMSSSRTMDKQTIAI